MIAHRGTIGLSQPNLIEGLHDLPGEIDGVEIDVRVTADGVAVVHHDAEIKADSGESLVIADAQYLEIRATTLSGGGRVPRLQDYLFACHHRALKQVYVDIKLPSPTGIDSVLAVVQQSRLREQIRLMTKSVDVAGAIHDHLPSQSVIFLRVSEKNLEQALELYSDGLVDCLVPRPRDKFIDENPEFLGLLMRNGVAVGVSIINKPENLRSAKEIGCEFAITDQPLLAQSAASG